jgi:hypothetical protein
LWVGRISTNDKADLLPLIEVFREIVADHPASSLLLVIAGTPREESLHHLMQYVNSVGLGHKVVVIEQFPEEKKHILFGAADVFVSPVDNVQESFGITPAEAMACGVPQVVSDWNGYRDIVEHGVTGFRVATYWTRCDSEIRKSSFVSSRDSTHLRLAQSVAIDTRVLRSCLESILFNDVLRTKMSIASRQRALTHYNWRNIIAKYEELWIDSMTESSQHRHNESTRLIDDLPYFDLFGHYASHFISSHTSFTLTSRGKKLLNYFRNSIGENPLQFFGASMVSIDTSLLKNILTFLKRAPHKKLDGSTNAVVNDILSADVLPRDKITSHLMWLVKHGFVQVN